MEREQERPDVVLFANGPGEVLTWLVPVVRALRARLGDSIRITAMLPPCAFASGEEARMVAEIDGIDRILPPDRYSRFFLLGPRAGRVPFNRHRGVVVHLGGDHFQSGVTAKRLGYPAIVYTEGRIHHQGLFSSILTDYEHSRQRLLRQGASEAKIRVVGNLMLDAVTTSGKVSDTRARLGLEDGRPVVGILPGSRAAHFRFTAPFLIRVVDALAERLPGTQFVLQVSPAMAYADVGSFLSADGKLMPGLISELIPGPVRGSFHGASLTTMSGTKVRISASNRYDTMSCMDLAMTIPGSNNMELAFLGVPMVVSVPLNRPQDIPLEGLAGLIGSIPIIGWRLKSKAVMSYASRVEYASLPNRVAGRFVVPELKGILSPHDVATEAYKLLSDPERLAAVSSELREVAGVKGASLALAEVVAEHLGIF